MISRRAWLKEAAFVSLAPAAPAFLARTARAAPPERDGRVLVVVQLDGGNDGINTLVPFGDEAYRRHRRALRLDPGSLLKVGDGLGLHPAMRGAADLLDAGRLAIVQGVGYPNPDRSHFESMRIWHTARLGPAAADAPGWLGRALDAGPRGVGPEAVFVGDQALPRALAARRAATTSLTDPADLALALPGHPDPGSRPAGDGLEAFVHRAVTDAYATAAEIQAATARAGGAAARYPETSLARRLELIARSIKAGTRARVYYAIQAGYDTHAAQPPAHAALLGELSGGIKAFLDDLGAAGLAERVVVLAFSEFGRRPAENGSLGTDHGTAGPVLLAGPSVRPGVHGRTPRLDDLEGGDLKWSTDFRGVYATLLSRWLGLPADQALGGNFDPLPLLDD